MGYELINRTKKERISFFRVGATKARELAGNPVSAAITTWYLLVNQGDEIAFIDDTSGELKKYIHFPDKTKEAIDQLIENEILLDEGKEFYFHDEPDIWDRKLRNVWISRSKATKE